jgi:hypothetical protein
LLDGIVVGKRNIRWPTPRIRMRSSRARSPRNQAGKEVGNVSKKEAEKDDESSHDRP